MSQINFLVCHRQLTALPFGTEAVFTFWNGMTHQTQLHILLLCAGCKLIDSLVVFLDRMWRRPADILSQLEIFGDVEWEHQTTIKTSMQGSGERKTAWLFVRK